MSLDTDEYQQMVGAGSDLEVIAEPVDYDRDDVPYPMGWDVDMATDARTMVLEPGRETEPLAAGLGRYTLFGTCGNLQEIFGEKRCSIYPIRPKVCRDFEAGSPKCDLLRRVRGVE